LRAVVGLAESGLETAYISKLVYAFESQFYTISKLYRLDLLWILQLQTESKSKFITLLTYIQFPTRSHTVAAQGGINAALGNMKGG
jgi:hypothetical protein